MSNWFLSKNSFPLTFLLTKLRRKCRLQGEKRQTFRMRMNGIENVALWYLNTVGQFLQTWEYIWKDKMPPNFTLQEQSNESLFWIKLWDIFSIQSREFNRMFWLLSWEGFEDCHSAIRKLALNSLFWKWPAFKTNLKLPVKTFISIFVPSFIRQLRKILSTNYKD